MYVVYSRSLFPCGDSLVAIIDDREDVWGRSPNLIHVKPYLFFSGTTDINAPPTLHRGRRRLGKQQHPYQQKRPPGKGHSLSNPLPFKTRHVLNQPTRGMSVRSRVAGGVARVAQSKKIPESTRSYGDTVENAAVGGSQCVEEARVSLASSTCERSSSAVATTTDAQEYVESTGGHVTHSGTAEGSQSVGVCIQEEQGNEEFPMEQNEGFEQGTSERLVDVGVDDSGDHCVTETTSLSQNVPVSSAEGISSNTNTSNNNNNNNNVKDADEGTSKNENESDGESSSDSSSSSSSSGSSGIDDSLFDDMAARDGGDEADGDNSVSSSKQNGTVVLSEAAAIASAADDLSRETGKGGSVSEISLSGGKGVEPRLPAPQPPPVEIKDPDTFLLQLADILERVHAIFYQQYDNVATSGKDYTIPDLKKIIPELRQSILKGCRIVFTGVIPTNAPPRKNAEWRTARAFGATIHTELVPGLDSADETVVARATTHVIAGKPGTSKLQDAVRLPGVNIVSTKWLWACAEKWKRVDEGDYLMDHLKGKKRKENDGNGPPCKKMTLAQGEEAIVKNQDEVDSAKVSVQALRHSVDEPPAISTGDREEDDSNSGSSASDDIFKQSSALSSLAKMDTTELKRHLSMESRLSVSDEELVRMEAEVEAEISESSSSGSSRDGGDGEELGSHVEMPDNNEELSYENFAGTDDSDDLDSILQERRKRKLGDLEGSSSSDSDVAVADNFLNESVMSDEDLNVSRSGEEEEDELSKLLGF